MTIRFLAIHIRKTTFSMKKRALKTFTMIIMARIVLFHESIREVEGRIALKANNSINRNIQ